MNTNEYLSQINEASKYVIDKVGICEVALVLGSGLNKFVENLSDSITLNYSDIPYVPQTHVIGHYGKLVVGYLPSIDGKPLRIMCFAGRVHAYEGWRPYEINFMARMSAQIGVKLFILTNASGGAQKGMTPGSVMVIRDHIRLIDLEPMMDVCNDSRFGQRHIIPQNGWSDRMAQVARDVSKELNTPIYEGTYVWCSGPTYETHSEVQAGIKMGAGAFGMSTVPEFFAAIGAQMEVFGMSMATNMAAGLVDEELTHEDVAKVAAEAGPRFEKIMLEVVARSRVKNNNNNNNNNIFNNDKKPNILTPMRPKLWFPTLSEVKSDAKIFENFKASFVIVNHCNINIISLIDEKNISLNDLPTFKQHSYSTSGKMGQLKYGYLDNNRKYGIVIIYNLYPEGFIKSEATFLAQVLRLIGTKCVLTTITTQSFNNNNNNNEIMYIADSLDRCGGYAPLLCCGQIGQPNYEHDSRYCNELRQNKKCARYVQFPGPSLPSNAEKFAVNLMNNNNNNTFGITNISFLETARSMGLCTVGLMVCVTDLINSKISNEMSNQVWKEINDIVLNNDKHFNNNNNKLGDLNSIEESKYYTNKNALSERVIGQEDYEQVYKSAEWCQNNLELKDIETAVFWEESFNALNEQFIIEQEISCTNIVGWTENGVGGDFHELNSKWNLMIGKFDEQSPRILCITCKSNNNNNLLHHSQVLQFEGLGYMVRMLKLMNINRLLFVTNLTSCDSNLTKINDVVIIRDHINLTGVNPLFGMNNDKWGARFIDAGNIYNSKIQDAMSNAMNKSPSRVIVAQIVNPAVDSSAEGDFCRSIGAHTMTCGICPHIIRGHHSGIKLGAIGFVSQEVTDTNKIIQAPLKVNEVIIQEIINGLKGAIQVQL